MKIVSLELENIRSYEKSKIEFPEGIILFVGDIGSGKSTILMAIEFALFGLGDYKGASLLRIGRKKGSVKLRFEVNGREYEIYRVLQRKGKSVHQGEGYIDDGRGKLHLSATELKQKVLEILNFKEPLSPRAQSVIYRYAVFTPQEEMKVILNQNPDERLKTLRKAFGIEDYKIASNNALLLASVIRKRADILGGEVQDLESLKEELMELEKEIEKEKKELEKLRKEELKIKEKLENRKKELDGFRNTEKSLREVVAKIPEIRKQIDDKKKQIEKLKKEITNLNNKNKLILEDIEDLKKLKKPTEKSEDEISEKIKELKKLDREKTKLLGLVSGINQDLKKLERKLSEYKDKSLMEVQRLIQTFETKKAEIEKEVEKIDVSKEEVQNEMLSRQNKLEDLEKRLKDLKDAGNKCPICNNDLTEEDKRKLAREKKELIAKLKKELEEYKKIGKSLETKKKELEKKYRKIEKDIQNLEKIQEDIRVRDDKRSQLVKLHRKIKEIESKMQIKEERSFPFLSEFKTPIDYLEALKEELRKYLQNQQRIEELNRQTKENKDRIANCKREIKDLSMEIRDLTLRLRESAKKQKELENLLKKIDRLEEDVEVLQNEHRKIGDKITEIRTLIREREDNVRKIRRLIKEKEKKKETKEKLEEFSNWIRDYLVPSLESIERHVMFTINQEFNQLFNHWFSILVDDPTKTSRVDEDFTPIVEQEGYEEVDLSGGEKTSVALAYRLALNTIVRKTSPGLKDGLIIMDEPTDGFSKEQLFKVREILDELESKQIIIVSHERELESFADHIFRVEKFNGISKVIKA